MNETYNSYQEDPQMPERWIVLASVLFLLIAMIVLLSGCKTHYIPVEKTVTEVRYRDSIRHDSIYQRDSIYLEVGKDTVYKYKQRTEYRYLFINKTDTLCLTDTIRTERTVEVAKPLKWHEQGFMWVGKLALGLLALAAVWFVAKKR